MVVFARFTNSFKFRISDRMLFLLRVINIEGYLPLVDKWKNSHFIREQQIKLATKENQLLINIHVFKKKKFSYKN